MTDRGATALVVEVPEAEPVVASHRLRLDAVAPLGVPAHVTVLYPFVAATEVDDRLLDTLAGVFGRCRAFGFRLSSTAWFGSEVLYLAADDPAPFSALTAAAAAAFPDHPPYGGAFTDNVPHLTVGQGHDVALLRAAEREIAPRLPVRGTASAVTLLRQTAPGRPWERHARFDLNRQSG